MQIHENVSATLDVTFAALASPVRRQILAILAEGETPLGKLAQPFEMSQTAVTKHVRVLEGAGLVRIQKRGRTHHCRLHPRPMHAAFDWLEFYRQFWEGGLDRLGQVLAEEDTR